MKQINSLNTIIPGAIRYFVLLFLALMPLNGRAQSKIIAQSDINKPEWVDTAGPAHLSAVTAASTVERAEERACRQIREQLIRAMATQLLAEGVLHTSDSLAQQRVLQFLSAKGASAYMRLGSTAYLSDAAILRTGAVYWEKYQDDNSQVQTIHYHLRYPFPEKERQRLAHEYRLEDQRQEKRLSAICNAIHQISTVENISERSDSLLLLFHYFDDERKEQTRQCLDNYRKLYSRLKLEITGSPDNRLSFRLTFDGQPIATGKKAQVRSNCATYISVTDARQGTGATVAYTTGECAATPDDEPENYIEISYNFSGKIISTRSIIPQQNL